MTEKPDENAEKTTPPPIFFAPRKKTFLDRAVPAAVLVGMFSCVGGSLYALMRNPNETGQAMAETRINMVLDNDQKLFYHDGVAYGPNGAIYQGGCRFHFLDKTCHKWESDKQQATPVELSDAEWGATAEKARIQLTNTLNTSTAPPPWLYEIFDATYSHSNNHDQAVPSGP